LEFVSVENQLGGYDRSELQTDFATAMALLHPDDLERAERATRAYLSGQTKEYEAEGRFRQKDGSYRWKLARGMAVRDAPGRAIRLMISSVDINDLKRAQEALRESKEVGPTRRCRSDSRRADRDGWAAEPAAGGTLDRAVASPGRRWWWARVNARRGPPTGPLRTSNHLKTRRRE
jgi:PAS domain S-box-containing protein